MSEGYDYFIVEPDDLRKWGAADPMTKAQVEEVINNADGQPLLVIYGRIAKIGIVE